MCWLTKNGVAEVVSVTATASPARAAARPDQRRFQPAFMCVCTHKDSRPNQISPPIRVQILGADKAARCEHAMKLYPLHQQPDGASILCDAGGASVQIECLTGLTASETGFRAEFHRVFFCPTQNDSTCTVYVHNITAGRRDAAQYGE